MDRQLGRLHALTVAIGMLLVGVVAANGQEADSTMDFPVREYTGYRVDTGELSNPSAQFKVVFEDIIRIEGTAWLRLYFNDAQLAKGSYVRMTSLFDKEVQELDLDGLMMWNLSSAYFNGDAVLLELVASPQSKGNRLLLGYLGTHMLPDGVRGLCADDDCGICGSDDRVLSNENWSGRLMPVGCTGSVYNDESCVVTAGHCSDDGYDDVIQFNVPSSSSNCYPYNPSVVDQFPITDRMYENNGPGDDWSVLTTGTNSSGQTIYERYGLLRPIATTLGSSGQTVEVWGFGVDNSDPTRSQDQQYSVGPIYARYNDRYAITVDITYGNSGGGLMRNDEIIGIVTHCSIGCPNTATRINNPDFVSARASLCPAGGSDYCSAESNSTSYEHITNVAVGTIDNASGATAYSDYTNLSTTMEIGQSYPITVTISSEWDSDIGGCWIDWNQDDSFDDANETITVAWSGQGPDYVASITPPAGAETGLTRMRIRIQDSNYDDTLSPCGDTDYGEVEDYSINVIAVVDNNPPLPNPMTFSSPPAPESAVSVTMITTEGIDPEGATPVSYYFDNAADEGGHDSGWQTSRVYTDVGLTPNTMYSYRVRARDSAAQANLGEYSTWASTYTYAAVPPQPDLTGVNGRTLSLNVNYGSNPADYTVFAVRCNSSSPTDSTWQGKFVDAAGNPSNTAVWLTDAQWGIKTVQGLELSTTYGFQVKARNVNSIETAYGTANYALTDECDVPGDCSDGVDCTDDVCTGGTCVNTANDANCEDYQFCNGSETCHPTLDCQSGSYPCGALECNETFDICVECTEDYHCDDDVPCTEDVCNGGTCVNTPDDDYCDDHSFCNGVETCDVELDCVSGSDPCPGQGCDEQNDQCVGYGDGDFDGDGDIDLVDFAEFTGCFGVAPVVGVCTDGDMEGDGDVDLDDFGLFMDAMVGP